MPVRESASYDAVVVGAGFAGMYMLHRLRQSGLKVRLIEAGGGPGGVWYWNRYPGARCDVESMEYQYGFDPELVRDWTWSERYGTQPEILNYVNFVADRLDIYRDAEFNTRIRSIEWDDKTKGWVLTSEAGKTFHTPHCIMATGHLSATNKVAFPGRDSFKGRQFHTGEWPHEGVDFTGRRVAVIGTGSSGVQSIPPIARQAGHLYVFQRTPSYSLPAEMRPWTEEEIAAAKSSHAALLEKAKYHPSLSFRSPSDESIFDFTPAAVQERLEISWRLGGFTFLQSFNDAMSKLEANKIVSEFVRNKIRQTVRDPKVAELLCPTYPIGTKRPCLDTGYYETYNRPNVTLVDVSAAPIEAITERGLCCGGVEYEVDDIVHATGFDAMTGALSRIDIRGRDGLSLKEKWAAGPVTYLGLGSAGFPNLFIITGPGSPSVLANCILGAEQQVEWIGDCIDELRRRGCRTIEPTPAAETDWGQQVNELARDTLYHHANSWYLGANIPGKPRVFLPYLGHGRYRTKCNEVAAAGYSGFAIA